MIYAISLQVFGCIGLGALAVLLAAFALPPSMRTRFRGELRERPLEAAAVAWLAGILINHIALIALGQLRYVSYVSDFGWAISVVAVTAVLAKGWRPRLSKAERGRLAAALYLTALLAAPMIAEPLYAWDARSVWFFHARMIYFGHGLVRDAGWLLPDVSFSHPDYPKLIPGLAAQVAQAVGGWNEFAPKASLLSLLGPVGLLLAARPRDLASFVLAAALWLFVAGAVMWNGYMDGWVATYAAVAFLCLSDAAENGRLVDTALGCLCLGILSVLKNEGIVLSGVIAAVVYARTFRRLSVRDSLRAAAVLCFAHLPWVLWAAKKSAWGLTSYFSAGSATERLSQRLADPQSLRLIAESGLQLGSHWYLTALAACAFALLWTRTTGAARRAAVAACAAAAVYSGVLVVVYLETPFALDWHLKTSMARVTLPIGSFLGTACLFLLRGAFDRRVSLSGADATRDHDEAQPRDALEKPLQRA